MDQNKAWPGDRLLTKWEQWAGKTVRGVERFNGDDVCVAFTDGTFSVLTGSAEDCPQCDSCSVEASPDLEFAAGIPELWRFGVPGEVHRASAGLPVRLGIATQAELDAAVEASRPELDRRQAEQKARVEQTERLQLKHLLAKYPDAAGSAAGGVA